jgi:clan AA aspartic protease (TIGR02281 family)
MPCKINGLKLGFIFDTGASNVCISLSEALFMLKNGYLNESDLKGSSYSQIANGEIVENTTVILREVEIADIKLTNIEAVIIHELTAPLLLGNSAIKKLGKISIENNELIIGTESQSSQLSSITTNSSANIIEDFCEFIDYDKSYWDFGEGKKELIYFLQKCAELGNSEAQFHLGEELYYNNLFEKQNEELKLAFHWYKTSAENGNLKAQYRLGEIYETDKIVSKDTEQARYWFQVAAENGDANAQFSLGFMFQEENNFEKAKYWYNKSIHEDYRAAIELGDMYFYGKGVTLDYDKAFECYSKLDDLVEFQEIKDTLVINFIEAKAKKGSSEAQFMLWEKYWYSDTEQAFNWLNKSAENGYSKAQYMLGELHYVGGKFTYSGYEIDKDYKKAEYWWLKSAKQGEVLAQTNLGCIYCDNDIYHTMSYQYNSKSGGVKIPVDYNKAFFWLDKAVKNGNNHAKSVLSWMYANGFGTTKELSEAFKLTKEVAEQGDLNAQLNLGYMYELGEGTNKDMGQAIYWYKKAAINGNTEAQKIIGSNYLFDKQDYRSAFFWYEKAAKQGDDEAQFTIGNMYSDGKGVLLDDNQAVVWYKKAALQDNISAQFNLGLMYLGGFGVETNKKEAAHWIKKSYDNGYEKAKEVWEEYELWKYQ